MTATRSFIIAAALAALAIAAALAFIMYRPGPADDGASVPVAGNPVSPAGTTTQPDPSAVMLAAPVFDIVRVAPAGTAVIAGRGEPGAMIQLLANEVALEFENANSRTDRMPINERGEWVIILNDPLPSGAVELSLMMTAADGRQLRSDQVVVVSIPEQRGPTPLVVEYN